MTQCKFFNMLDERWAKGARICVGLDSDPRKIAERFRHPTGYGSVDLFNGEIVRATSDLALAYKLNIAFYSGKYSLDSLKMLYASIKAIRAYAFDVPIILDSKRGDIGNTNVGYVEEAFESFDADAMTINPLFGLEANRPFLDQKDKGIIILCKTSNKGSGEFQDLQVSPIFPGGPTLKLYEYIASRVRSSWNYNGNCALVVGATYPDELKSVRYIAGDMWILAPGIGTQGGDVEATVKNGLNSKGSGLIINNGSAIIFASPGADFAEAARAQLIYNTAAVDRALPRGSLINKLV